MKKNISIITGHYGSGKTNIAANMALSLRKTGQDVTIVDLDIVNPYFRTFDLKEQFEAEGIRVIAPVYANTNLDIPALPPDIQSMFDQSGGEVIIDVGGDDAGAIALGQFASRILAAGYEMYYVINERRYLTRDAQDAAILLKEIEAASRIPATKLINNTNLGRETTLEMVEHSKSFAEEVSRLTGLPVAFSCIDKRLLSKDSDYFGVDILVKTAWA